MLSDSKNRKETLDKYLIQILPKSTPDISVALSFLYAIFEQAPELKKYHYELESHIIYSQLSSELFSIIISKIPRFISLAKQGKVNANTLHEIDTKIQALTSGKITLLELIRENNPEKWKNVASLHDNNILSEIKSKKSSGSESISGPGYEFSFEGSSK